MRESRNIPQCLSDANSMLRYQHVVILHAPCHAQQCPCVSLIVCVRYTHIYSRDAFALYVVGSIRMWHQAPCKAAQFAFQSAQVYEAQEHANQFAPQRLLSQSVSIFDLILCKKYIFKFNLLDMSLYRDYCLSTNVPSSDLKFAKKRSQIKFIR